ncbi:MAG: hypothetical protein RMJ00_00720 [Nitrososphaerota archaeon]|nr:hypothetical protein [Nitrososphaerota archaeon]
MRNSKWFIVELFLEYTLILTFTSWPPSLFRYLSLEDWRTIKVDPVLANIV